MTILALAILLAPLWSPRCPAGPRDLSSMKAVIIVGRDLPPPGRFCQDWADTLESYGFETQVFVPPDATWSRACPALQGASLVIYQGHGAGYDWSPATHPSQGDKNGFFIDRDPSQREANRREGWITRSVIQSDVRLADRALVVLAGACYSAGKWNEDEFSMTGLDLVRRRIDEYSRTFLDMGANYLAATDDFTWQFWSDFFEKGMTLEEARDSGLHREGCTVETYDHPLCPGRRVEFDYESYGPGTEDWAANVAAGDLGTRACDFLPVAEEPDRSVQRGQTPLHTLHRSDEGLGLVALVNPGWPWQDPYVVCGDEKILAGPRNVKAVNISTADMGSASLEVTGGRKVRIAYPGGAALTVEGRAGPGEQWVMLQGIEPVGSDEYLVLRNPLGVGQSAIVKRGGHRLAEVHLPPSSNATISMQQR